MPRILSTPDSDHTGAYEAFMRSEAGDNSLRMQAYKTALKDIIQSELTDRQREALTLYYFDRLKIREAAVQMGISGAAVSTHIRRGMKRLKKYMDYSFRYRA